MVSSARRSGSFTALQHGQGTRGDTVGQPRARVRNRPTMPGARRIHCCLLLALAGVLLAPVASSAAETYGELHHFGAAGNGHGQFKITSGTHAFGVDPATDTVYVGDEPKKREYRVQELSAAGGFIAQTLSFKPPNHDGIEGIAVDPVEKRLYVLALETRGASTVIEPGQPVAGTLYAFSTEPSGEVLAPAPGAGAEGVLAGPEVLAAQSDEPEKALLEPKGITVDPTTHDVIILGEVALHTPKEGEEPQLRIALERIHANGTLGAKYVDTGGVLAAASEPNSPVVSASGAVYLELTQGVEREDPLTGLTEETNQIMQVPSSFASTEPPKPYLSLAVRDPQESQGHPVVEFDSSEPARDGGGLSYAPEAPGGTGAGTLYARAHIFVEEEEEGASYPGALAFAAGGGAELGWTGGQTKKSGTEECTISFGGEAYPLVAAGGGQTVFMLDPGKASPFRAPHVVEFGPGGSGCPTAEATSPSATVNGQPLSPTETIAPGTPVTFSSTLTQANALSVEWSFGDGETQTESADEYLRTKVTHAFARGGKLTVTETIHTDDLATPTIVRQTTVSVTDTAAPPTAVLEGPLELTLGAEGTQRLVYLEGGGFGLQVGKAGASATFDGSASFDPNPPGSNRIVLYHWVFGDGGTETTESATATHEYGQVGEYKVQLTVTDTAGLTSEPSTLNVKVDAPAPTAGVPGQPPQAPPAVASAARPQAPAPTPVIPAAGLVSTSLLTSPTGTVQLVITCPTGATSCIGAVTLRTLAAVGGGASDRRSRAKRPQAAILTLATGRFTVVGGDQKTLTLRLTAKARALLARSHQLRVRATIAAHDAAGAKHTTSLIVLLRLKVQHVKKLIIHSR